MTGSRPRILLFRTGRMGDMAMFTATLQALFEAFPDAEFHLVTSREGERLLRHYDPRITRTFVYSRSIRKAPGTRWRLRRSLRKAGYERAFVFEPNPHYEQLCAGVAPDMELLRDPSHPHRVQQEIGVLQRAGVWNGITPWTALSVTEEGERAARALLEQHGVSADSIVVGFHPTSGYLKRFRIRRDRQQHRAWPTDSFAELARMLVKHANATGTPLRLLIDVLPDERSYADEILKKSGGLVTVLDAPPDLERYKAVLRRMNLLVTIDTGPMHVAAALGTPLVALFSDTHPAMYGPFMPPARFVTLRANAYAGPAAGMAAIPPRAVFEACLNLLPDGPDG